MFQFLSPKVEQPSGYYPMGQDRGMKEKTAELSSRPKDMMTLISPPTNQLPAQPQTSNPWCLVILFRAQAPHLQSGLLNIKLFFRCCFCTANSCLCISWGQCMQAGGPKEKYWGSSNTSISKKAWVLRASGLVNTWRFRDSSMPKHSMKSPCPFPHTICLAACQGLAGPL